MQVMFTRWSIAPEQRTSVSVNPKRVDCVELVSDTQFVRAAVWTGDPTHKFDDMMQVPACTKIAMQGKQEFWVQGTVAEVTEALNGGDV